MMRGKKLPGFTGEQLSENLLPLLLASMVCFASFYTFHKLSAYVLGLLFFLEAAFFFRLFDKLHARKYGGFFYALILAAAVLLTHLLVMLNRSRNGRFSPMRWFFNLDVEKFQPDLLAALFIGGGFFLISVVYYFTKVRFRTVGVMLSTLFPFFFFARRSDTMPDILITLIMLLFLGVIIHNKRLGSYDKKKKPVRLKLDKAYIICIAVFILFTGAISMALEKPFHESLFEKNARLFAPLNFLGGVSSGYEELSSDSSPRNGRPNPTYDPLFYMESDSGAQEIFLRSKAFDVFNGDVWESNQTWNTSYYSSRYPEYATDDILSDMSAVTGRDLSGLYSLQSGRVYDRSFSPVYLPAPYGVITDNASVYSLKYYKLTSDTSVLRTRVFYNIPPLNDSFTYIEQQGLLYQFARELGFSSQEYIEYLLSFDNENEEAVMRLYEDYYKALQSYSDLSHISDRLMALSREIVADCHSDIEKAAALENYFTENGYAYSLTYVPEDNSVDHFVFESRIGYCAGYATAMTLMARAVGLPARYVEGFAAFEKNGDGSFVIRDGYAHAFVEVYIPGAGWLTFDPTVPGYRDYSPGDVDGANGSLLSGLLSAANRVWVIFVIALMLMFFAISDRIRDLFLRIHIRFKPVNERIIMLYGNLVKRLGAAAGEDCSSYTPDMVRARLLQQKGAAPERLIRLFEKTAFGGYACSKEEFTAAYKEYKKVR